MPEKSYEQHNTSNHLIEQVAADPQLAADLEAQILLERVCVPLVAAIDEQVAWGRPAGAEARQLRAALEALGEPARTLGQLQYARYLALDRIPRQPRPEHDNRRRPGRKQKRVDRRKRPGRVRTGRPEGRVWERVGITALDGEGWGVDEGGRQDYRLLVACKVDGAGKLAWRLSLGDGSHHLHAFEILDWLMRLPKVGHLVGFSLGYDWAQWLRELPPELLEKIVKNRRTRWTWGPDEKCDWFELSMIPGKVLTIRRPVFACSSGIEGYYEREVWDAFSWYQRGFLSVVEKSALVHPADLEVIRQGKEERGDELKDVRRQREYAHRETYYLAQLQRQLYQLCREAGYELHRYHGPGALADRMFEEHRVMEHAGDPLPDEMKHAVQCAYFGGRFENALVGQVPYLEQWDLRSAYPWAASRLPSLRGARWEHVEDPTGLSAGLYRVRWKAEQRFHLGSFPVRYSNQTIGWPLEGESWVWHPELQIALGCGWDFDVLEGWALRLDSDDRPFAWLEDVYRRRAELAAANNPLQIVFKLGPNSVYGKLAQDVGARRHQQMVWASLITSMIRARLLEAIARAPTGAIAVTATDGVYSLVPLDWESSNELGAWHREAELHDVLVGGSGFMCAGEEMEALKTRGLGRAEAPFPQLAAAWDEFLKGVVEKTGPYLFPGKNGGDLPQVKALVRRFVGLQLGLLWGKPEKIGRWEEAERFCSFGSDKSPGVAGWYRACPDVEELRSAVRLVPRAQEGPPLPYDRIKAWQIFQESRAEEKDQP